MRSGRTQGPGGGACRASVPGMRAALARRLLATAGLAAAATAWWAAGGRAAAAAPVPRAERAQIEDAFERVFSSTPTSAPERFVQSGSAALEAALQSAITSIVQSDASPPPRLDAAVGAIAPFAPGVARVRFDLVDRYRGGVLRTPFTGAAVEVGGRWTVGWATACFVAETNDATCPTPPPDAAILPLPSTPLDRAPAHTPALGLIFPGALAIAPDGDLLIADSGRDQLLARSPTGALRVVAGTGATGHSGDGGPAIAATLDFRYGPVTIAVAPDGTLYLSQPAAQRIRVIEPDGTISTLPAHLPGLAGLALAPSGTLFAAVGNAIDEITPSGAVSTFAAGRGRRHQLWIGDRDHGYFAPELVALDGMGDVYAFSSSPKYLVEFSPSGTPLRAWTSYDTALATAPDGSIVVGDHGAGLDRVAGGRLTSLVNLLKLPIDGYPSGGAGSGAFQPDGVAVAADGTIDIDTALGNGWTTETAIAAVAPDGHAQILPITTPLLDTLPALGAAGFPTSRYPAPAPARAAGALAACPSSAGLERFDAAARAQAIAAARTIDVSFHTGLLDSDRAWWPGLYGDRLAADYQIGRHAVGSVGPATGDLYAPAVRRACGAALLARSLAVVIHRSAYSFQVSHLYFVDRDGRALLYWQHT